MTKKLELKHFKFSERELKLIKAQIAIGVRTSVIKSNFINPKTKSEITHKTFLGIIDDIRSEVINESSEIAHNLAIDAVKNIQDPRLALSFCKYFEKITNRTIRQHKRVKIGKRVSEALTKEEAIKILQEAHLNQEISGYELEPQLKAIDLRYNDANAEPKALLLKLDSHHANEIEE